MFLDKRIAFTDEEYLLRSQLAVIHWNENVDRKYTSVYVYRNSRKQSKVLTKSTFQYRNKLWISLISRLKC